MSISEASAVECGSITSEASSDASAVTRAVGLIHFPQSCSDNDGERLCGWVLGDGNALIWHVEDGAGERVTTDVVEVLLMSEADVRLLQERHSRKQIDLRWILDLKDEDSNDCVWADILYRDLWEGITLLEMPSEERAMPPYWIAGEALARAADEQRTAVQAEQVAKDWEELKAERERNCAMVAAQEVEAARRDRRAGDVKVTA